MAKRSIGRVLSVDGTGHATACARDEGSFGDGGGAWTRASREAAPASPSTSAWTFRNIGNEKESKVNEQTVAASAAPARAPHNRRSSGSLVRRRDPSATQKGTTRYSVKRTSPTSPSSTAVLRNWLSRMSNVFCWMYVPPPWPNHGASRTRRSTSG